MNEVIVSGIAQKVNTFEGKTKIVEVTLTGKANGGFATTRVKLFGKLAERYDPVEGKAYLAEGSLIQGRNGGVEVMARTLVELDGAEVAENDYGPYLSDATNRVVVAGHLGATPKLKPIEVGEEKETIALTTASLALNTPGREEPTWVPLKAWSEPAEYLAGYEKGQYVVVQGRLRLQSWTDKESGEKRYRQVVLVDRVLGGGRIARVKQTDAAEEGAFPKEAPF